jgi:hypothetical protein
MRKLISLGILALLLSMLASPVSAGDKSICIGLKGVSKSLYGLCVAYQNTEDGSAKEKIMGNFTRRARNGEKMPTLDPKEPETVACPCWNNEDLLRATCTATYDDHWFSDDGINVDVVFYNFYTIQFDADHVIDSAGETVTTCSLNVFADGYVAAHNFTSSAENLECRAGLRVLVNEDLLDLCP